MKLYTPTFYVFIYYVPIFCMPTVLPSIFVLITVLISFNSFGAVVPEVLDEIILNPIISAVTMRNADIGTHISADIIGTDINAYDSFGKTALIRAVCERNTLGVEKLLAISGIDVNQKEKYMGTSEIIKTVFPAYTALHYGAIFALYNKKLKNNGKSYNFPILEALLKVSTIKINQPNVNGRTALHDAVFCQASGVVQLFLDAGADIDCDGDGGKSTLAEIMQHVKMFDGSHAVVKRNEELVAYYRAVEEIFVRTIDERSAVLNGPVELNGHTGSQKIFKEGEYDECYKINFPIMALS